MIRFALVGCGRIAYKHAENLNSTNVPNGKLVAVCDIDIEKAKTYGEKYDVPYYTDMHHMMTELKDKIDIVSVLTHSGAHATHAIELSKYKKHILVEKPMALSIDDADRMVNECKKNNVRLFIVKQNRFNPPVQKLIKAVP